MNSSDNSSGIEIIDIESENDCISITSESNDEIERNYFKSKVETSFTGEDLCERAHIERVVGETNIDEFNERYILEMMEKERQRDRDVEALISSIAGLDDSDETSSATLSDDEEFLIDEQKHMQRKNWKPNVLEPPMSDINDYYECHYTIDPLEFRRDLCLKYRSNAAVRVLDPFDNLNNGFAFNKKFKERLEKLNCKPHTIQLHSWPCILKKQSVSCISGPKSGKTNSYVIPLMCMFDTSEPDEDMRIGAIVICSSTRKTQTITREFRKWKLENESKVRIVLMNSSNEREQLASILNGVDILVTTPSPLLRCINSNLIDCKNAKCLIVDDADISLALHQKSILEIYLAFAKSKNAGLRQESDKVMGETPAAFQTLLFSEKWSKSVLWFYKEVQHMPILMYNSYLEASVALKINSTVVYFDNEMEREKKLKTLLESLKHMRHIAIVCRSKDEIRYLKRALGLKITESVTITEDTNHFDLANFGHIWKTFNRYLFITDDMIKTVMGFDVSECIIHYKLPTNFDETFGNRFKLMKSHFKRCKSPLDRGPVEELVNYILVSPEDQPLMPQLIAYLNRVKAKVPKSITNQIEYNKRDICRYFSAFGKCSLVSFRCNDRHSFNEFDLPNPRLPDSGQIKVVISYVVGANECFIRVNEFRGESQSSGMWKKMDQTFDDIKEELNAFLNTDYNTVKDVCFDKVYGISVRAQVLRVELVRIIRDEDVYFYQDYNPNDASQLIELFCIDYGHKFVSKSRQLFELPEELSSLPPFAYRAYLLGIKPIDNENEWDFRSTQKLYQLIDHYCIHQITAWVVKQVKGIFWLNRLYVKKKLLNACAYVEINPIQQLIDEKLVAVNTNHFQDTIDIYNITVNLWQSNRLKGLSFNTKLTDEITYVVVINYESIDEIYVMREFTVKRLQTLEDEWLSKFESLKVLTHLTEGQLCLYKYHDKCYNEDSVNRAKITTIYDKTVDLFLVDHGEIVRKVPKTDIYCIQEFHVKDLPFQAIKVKLFGIKVLKPLTYDLICDLTRNEADNYKMIIASKLSTDNDSHTVRLFVANDAKEAEFTALSKLLVDLKYAEYIDGEEDNELNLTLNRETEVEDDNELDSDYLEQLGDELQNNFVQHWILKFVGLEESEDIEEVSVEKKKETRMDRYRRTMKRINKNRALKAIAETNGEESDDEIPQQPIYPTVDYRPGDFDHELEEGCGIAYFDPNDDNGSLHSDEDIMFEEDYELS